MAISNAANAAMTDVMLNVRRVARDADMLRTATEVERPFLEDIGFDGRLAYYDALDMQEGGAKFASFQALDSLVKSGALTESTTGNYATWARAKAVAEAKAKGENTFGAFLQSSSSYNWSTPESAVAQFERLQASRRTFDVGNFLKWLAFAAGVVATGGAALGAFGAGTAATIGTAATVTTAVANGDIAAAATGAAGAAGITPPKLPDLPKLPDIKPPTIPTPALPTPSIPTPAVPAGIGAGRPLTQSDLDSLAQSIFNRLPGQGDRIPSGYAPAAAQSSGLLSTPAGMAIGGIGLLAGAFILLKLTKTI